MKIFFNTIFSVIKYELYIFKKKAKDDLINFLIWAIVSLFVGGIILTKTGIDKSFATLQFSGIVSNIGLWMGFHEAVKFVTDFENKKIIYYNLSFPIPSCILFLSKIISYTIYFSMISFFCFLFIKLIFYNIIDLNYLSFLKLFIITLITNIFYGSWIIFISSVIKKSKNLGNLFGRIQFPLWFMGGFQFSWKTLYEVNKYIAYLDLLNPIIYINEGYKNAILGIEGLLSFPYLILVIFSFSLFLFLIGFSRLKKQLDFF